MRIINIICTSTNNYLQCEQSGGNDELIDGYVDNQTPPACCVQSQLKLVSWINLPTRAHQGQTALLKKARTEDSDVTQGQCFGVYNPAFSKTA